MGKKEVIWDELGKMRAKAFWGKLEAVDRRKYRKMMNTVKAMGQEIYADELKDEADACCSRNL